MDNKKNLQVNLSDEISYKCLTFDSSLGIFYNNTVNIPVNGTLLCKRNNTTP